MFSGDSSHDNDDDDGKKKEKKKTEKGNRDKKALSHQAYDMPGIQWTYSIPGPTQGDVENALSTKECEAPHIIAFTNGGVLCGLYIVCDNVYIEVDVKLGVMGALLNLIATYYIFDLEYPQMHAMILAILQTLVMEDPYMNTTSKGYKVFP